MASNPRRRRRRSRGGRRRRRFRNPRLGSGLDIQGALIGAAGALGARMLVNFIEKQTKQAFDPKIKAAAVLGIGAFVLPMMPGLPPGMKRSASTGAQISGAAMLLADLMPGAFGAYAPASEFTLGAYDTVPIALPEAGQLAGDEWSYNEGMGDAGSYEDLEAALATS